MFLITGLGNPGRRYRLNRHNAGFMLVDLLAERSGQHFSRILVHSVACEVEICGQAVVLAKPTTFMNLSGRAVRELIRKYSIDPAQLLVVFDDVALPLGTLRIRRSGSSGGHKGMQSIIEDLGTAEVQRLRIGVGREKQSGELSDFVLSDFEDAELPLLEETLDRGVQAAESILRDGLERAMGRFN